MSTLRARIAIQCIVVFTIIGAAAIGHAQEPESVGENPSLVMRCETYCSWTKLRTVNVRISWADPNLTLGRMADAVAGPIEQQLQTTVFRNGFADGQFATFSTLEPLPDARPVLAQPSQPQFRAFDLKIIGVTRPRASGEGARDILRLSPEQRRSSVVIEGLEPSLTYYWRIRFRTNSEWRTSEPAMCIAPICPADMREER